MITKTLNLDDAYAELFDEIREKSGGAIDINNVESFFGNIIEITALDKKYLRLPLDEPMFEIDANSRKITVPDAFKANGLSVQGDHLAETVYFVIDRYFDYMDLKNTEVTINWKMGAESGKTDKFTMSATVIPGCIVFGWPVNNVVTAKSGTLTFAVEFSRKDGEGNVLYDFNTLAASVNIKDGLVVSDVEVVNLDNDILAALENSEFAINENEAAVGDVTWLTGEGHGLVANLSSVNGQFRAAPYSNIINLDTNIVAGVPASVPVDLYAQGYVDAGSEVKYINMIGGDVPPAMLTVERELVAVEEGSSLDSNIKYFLEDGTIASSEQIEAWGEDDADALFESAALPEGVKYYVLAGEENPPAYELASDAQIEAWGTNAEVAIFIKLAKISATTAGSYVIKAQGQKFDNEGHKIGAGPTIMSDVIVIPEVEAPSAINVDPSDIAIDPSELEQDGIGYSFNPQNENVVFLDENDNTLTASAVVDNFGALKFVWKKKVGVNTYEDVNDEEAPYKNVNEDIFEVEEAGTYIVEVTNFLNGETSSAISSDEIIASPLAGKITSATPKFKAVNSNNFVPVTGNINFNSAEFTQQKQLQLVIDDVVIDGNEGTLEYKWYKELENGELELAGSEQILKVAPGDASYIPVVKNNLNGSIYTYTLSAIFVNDR